MFDHPAAQRPIVKVEHPHVYLVPSSSNPRQTWTVILGEDIEPRCDCPAYVACRHIRAAMAFDRQAVGEHYQRMVAQAAEANRPICTQCGETLWPTNPVWTDGRLTYHVVVDERGRCGSCQWDDGSDPTPVTHDEFADAVLGDAA